MDKINDDKLVKNLEVLTAHIERMESNAFSRLLNDPKHFFWYRFIGGIASGVGNILGATVVVALFLYILQRIQVAPIIGPFIADIVEQVMKSLSI